MSRSKTFNVTVEATISVEAYIIAILAVILSLVFFIPLFSLVPINRNNVYSRLTEENNDQANKEAQPNIRRLSDHLILARDSFSNSWQNLCYLVIAGFILLCSLIPINNVYSRSIEYNNDMANEEGQPLQKKLPKDLKRKSWQYLFYLLIFFVCYAMLAVQMVFNDQNGLHDTGNLDICYYNHLCSHPLSFLSDFNHVFSNIYYVILGAYLLRITYCRFSIYQIIA